MAAGERQTEQPEAMLVAVGQGAQGCCENPVAVVAATRRRVLLQDGNLKAARSEVKPARPRSPARPGGPRPLPITVGSAPARSRPDRRAGKLLPRGARAAGACRLRQVEAVVPRQVTPVRAAGHVYWSEWAVGGWRTPPPNNVLSPLLCPAAAPSRAWNTGGAAGTLIPPDRYRPRKASGGAPDPGSATGLSQPPGAGAGVGRRESGLMKG